MDKVRRNYLGKRWGRIGWQAWFSGCSGIPDSLGVTVHTFKLWFQEEGKLCRCFRAWPYPNRGVIDRFAFPKRDSNKDHWVSIQSHSQQQVLMGFFSVGGAHNMLCGLWVRGVLWAEGCNKKRKCSLTSLASHSRGDISLIAVDCSCEYWLIRVSSQFCDVIRAAAIAVSWQMKRHIHSKEFAGVGQLNCERFRMRISDYWTMVNFQTLSWGNIFFFSDFFFSLPNWIENIFFKLCL